MRPEPLISVTDVPRSSRFYQEIDVGRPRGYCYARGSDSGGSRYAPRVNAPVGLIKGFVTFNKGCAGGSGERALVAEIAADVAAFPGLQLLG